MVAAGGNFMQKTPQEAYDLIENMTRHHFQWDAEVYYNTTTDMSAHYSETTFASRERVEVLGKQTGYTIQSVQHNPGPGHPNPFYYSDSDESDDDEPSKMIEDQKSTHHLSGSPNPFSDPETSTLLPHHDSTSPEVDDDIFDPEGDIRLLERLLNLDSTKELPPPYELNNEIFDPEGDILILENLLKDDPSEAKNSEIDSLIKGPSDSDYILDETNTFLPHHDSTSPEVDDDIFDPEGDILFLEGLLNDEISSDLPPLELNIDLEGDILFLDNFALKMNLKEKNNSEINPLLGNLRIPFNGGQ
ncbi:hypothetical protein Tco_0491916 [Tanacetum coccineum]